MDEDELVCVWGGAGAYVSSSPEHEVLTVSYCD